VNVCEPSLKSGRENGTVRFVVMLNAAEEEVEDIYSALLKLGKVFLAGFPQRVVGYRYRRCSRFAFRHPLNEQIVPRVTNRAISRAKGKSRLTIRETTTNGRLHCRQR